MTFLQHLTQLFILSSYTVSIVSLDLLILSFNGFHLVCLIVLTTSHYLIIILLLLLHTQVFPMVQIMALCISTMYIKTLYAIIVSHSIILHSFGDELQLRMSAPHDWISELLHSTQSCIGDDKAWETAKMLKHNANKTELMLVTSKSTKHVHNLPTSITIGNAQFSSKQSVKNLCLTLDWHLNMLHVSPTLLGHATLNCVAWHLFVDSWQVLQLPHLYLLLFCQELT